jgi:molybdopterin-synthase adenylyltransferase
MLKASRVTVLGLGGIGSATAISLAASGIGQLHCVDGDRVELSNLNRQVFYCEADIGRPKAAALLDKVRALNAGVAVTTADRMLSRPADIINEVSGSDIFVLSADHPKEIVSWANRCALELGIPWVSASYAGPMMAIATFIPGVTGCHRCAIEGKGRRDDLLQLQPLPGAEARISGYNPVMAPTALMTSQLAAMEVIYYLVGLKVQTAGRVLHRNFLDYDHQYYIEADRRPGCGDCGPTASRMRDSHASRQ